jgi:hypothetical protein
MMRLRGRGAPTEWLTKVPIEMLFPALACEAQGKSLIMKGEKSHFESETTAYPSLGSHLLLTLEF